MLKPQMKAALGLISEEQKWLDLLLQHEVPEAVARSCIRDVADDAQLIAKIKEVAPGEGVENVVQILSFPEKCKRPWLSVFLRHRLVAEHAIDFLGRIEGGLPELGVKLQRLIPGEKGRFLTSQVHTFSIASCSARARLFIYVGVPRCYTQAARQVL